jgi:hypothetical protein
MVAIVYRKMYKRKTYKSSLHRKEWKEVDSEDDGTDLVSGTELFILKRPGEMYFTWTFF